MIDIDPERLMQMVENAEPTRDPDEMCKMLFCYYTAEITVFAPEYGEEIEVCPVCLAEKMGLKEPPEKRQALGEAFKRSLEPMAWEIVSDTTAADLGIPER